MPKKKLLLSGDDGYQAPGIRILARVLQETYEVKIAATKKQQSAVGGKISLKTGFEWGIAEVEGVEAIWADGTPADAVELASHYFGTDFEYVVAGINWGANLGTGNFGSGTVNACLRGLSIGLAPQAVSMSWGLPTSVYTRLHKPESSIDDFLNYPGRKALELLYALIGKNLFGAQMININFPREKTDVVKLTQATQYITDVFNLGDDEVVPPNGEKPGSFQYTGERKMQKLAGSSDLAAINNGFISITPYQADLTDKTLLAQLQNNLPDLFE